MKVLKPLTIIMIIVAAALILDLKYKDSSNSIISPSGETLVHEKNEVFFSSVSVNISEKEKQQMMNKGLGNNLVTAFNEMYDNDESMLFTLDDVIIKESEEDYEKAESIEVKITETSDDEISEDGLIKLRYFVTGAFEYKNKKGAYFSIVNQSGEILFEETI